jgi:hypothetical protein
MKSDKSNRDLESQKNVNMPGSSGSQSGSDRELRRGELDEESGGSSSGSRSSEGSSSENRGGSGNMGSSNVGSGSQGTGGR